MSDQSWGRAYLQRCGINPDNPEDVRSAYSVCRETHKQWLLSGAGDMDYETWGMLVDAIKSACGWLAIPLDWEAPHLVLLPEGGLRNTLTRSTGVIEVDPVDRLPRRRNPRIFCEEIAGTWIHGRPHSCPRSARGFHG